MINAATEFLKQVIQIPDKTAVNNLRRRLTGIDNFKKLKNTTYRVQYKIFNSWLKEMYLEERRKKQINYCHLVRVPQQYTQSKKMDKKTD